MACFLVPLILAAATTVLQLTVRNMAEKLRLWILDAFLWGGAILLGVEHVWRGEVVPWPPFLTAMSSPTEIPPMLHEMAVVGTTMSVAAFTVWGAILAISRYSTRTMGGRPRAGPVMRTEKPTMRPTAQRPRLSP